MSIKANSLIGLPVITIKDGKNVTTIKDIVYDGATNQVTAFVVDENGWFKVAKIILMKDVESIGKDAILIEDETKIVLADDGVDQSVALTANDDNFLDTNQVITKSGIKLGMVTDIYFNESTGKLEAIEVSEGFVSTLLSGTKKIEIDDIITVGKENLIVDDNVQESMDSQAQQQGINKVIEDTKTAGSAIASDAGAKIQEVTTSVSNKTEEVINSDQVQGAIAKTQEVIEVAKDKASDTFAKTKENIESGKTEEDLKTNFETAKDKISNVAGNLKEKVSDVAANTKDKIVEVSSSTSDKIQSTSNDVKEKILEDKIKEVVGKIIYNDAIIYGSDNKVIGIRGDVITPAMITKAKEEDAIDRLILSAST